MTINVYDIFSLSRSAVSLLERAHRLQRLVRLLDRLLERTEGSALNLENLCGARALRRMRVQEMGGIQMSNGGYTCIERTEF